MKRPSVWLTIVFLIVLTTRLYIAFQTPYFSSDEAYFHVRQVEHISGNGLPFFKDDLSYGSKLVFFSPGFDYALSLFSIFAPQQLIEKVLPNIFASLIIFLFYLLSLKITNDKNVSLFTAFISGFIPVLFEQTINTISPITLALLFILFLIYALLNITNSFFFISYLIVLVIASFTHPLIVFYAAGLLIYLLLLFVDNIKQERAELEVIIFSIFFILWAQFIIFKKVLLFHGITTIWQNIPSELFINYFQDVSLLETIYQIGIIPFVLGIYSVFRFLFKERKKEIYLLTSFILTASLALIFKLTPIITGLILLGVFLTLLFSYWLNSFLTVWRKTKIAHHEKILLIAFVIIFLFTSIIPSYIRASADVREVISGEDIDALMWLKKQTSENAIIFATPEEGNLISAIAKRKNVLDTNYLMARNVDEKYADIKTLFTTDRQVIAAEIMEKYGSEYIYFSSNAIRSFGLNSLRFLTGKSCFYPALEGKTKIYKKTCKVKIL